MGVKGVSNMIAVKPRAEPTEICTKIQEALKRDAEVDANRVLVETLGIGNSEWHRALQARTPRSRTRGVLGTARDLGWKTGTSSATHGLLAGVELAQANFVRS
jgi:hypothetical protein